MDEEKIKKQKLLKNEIIDRCYDQNAFIEFCMQERKDGDDLNNWTYDELKNVIQKFITKINSEYINQDKEQEIIIKENIEEVNIKENNNQNINKIEFVGKEKYNPNNIDNENKEINEVSKEEKSKEKIITIKCKELNKNILNDKKININIINPTFFKSKNILSESYVLYDIKTFTRQKNSNKSLNSKELDKNEKINFTVQRKYSDFLQIREILSKYFPYNYIPSLPDKTNEYLLNEENQNKIISYLQLFINGIVSKEDFKAFEAIFIFLTINDYNEYKNRIKEIISVIPPPLNAADVFDITGVKIFPQINENDYNNEIKIEENQNELYFFNIKNYFEIQYKLITQLKIHLKEFNNNFKNCFNNLQQIEQDFTFLCQLNNKVMMKEKIKKSFEELGLFFQGWKDLIKKQNILVKKYISFYYNFTLHESLAYVSLIKKRENIKNLYINEYKKLDQKKERMWKYEDIKKWEINYDNFNVDNILLLKDKKYAKSRMLYKETQEFEIIKNNFEYINYMNKNELESFLNNFLDGYKYFIQNFVKEFYPTLNDFINSWSSLSVFVN